ncbi:hypothetical protein [Pseudoalteromonas sp. DL2-H2.2]|nr:hypothetical protein [Pseudoalteromonas sp. DL2-H2.2]
MVVNINGLSDLWQLTQQWQKAMLLLYMIEAQLSPQQGTSSTGT